jgi:hypothetical protein
MSPKERDDPVRASVDEREDGQRRHGGEGDEKEHGGHQRKDRDALGGRQDAWRDCEHGNRGLLNLGKTGDLRLHTGAIVRPAGRMSPQVTRGQLPGLSTDRGTMASAGRRYGPFKGQTTAANELADWLRQLEVEFGTAKTVWSEYLSGAKLIPADLLDRLVTALVREPRLQARMREEAKALRSAAARPPQVRELSPQRPRSAPEQVNALQRQLTDALERQLEAERALYRSSQLVQTLLTMIAWLQGQCSVLAAERDRALEGNQDQALVHTRSELEQANQQLVRTQGELARARRERATAEEIKVAAQQAAEAYRQALEAIQRSGVGEQHATGDRMPQVVVAPAKPSLEDYAAVLDSVSSELDSQHQDLADLQARVGIPAGETQTGSSCMALSLLIRKHQRSKATRWLSASWPRKTRTTRGRCRPRQTPAIARRGATDGSNGSSASVRRSNRTSYASEGQAMSGIVRTRSLCNTVCFRARSRRSMIWMSSPITGSAQRKTRPGATGTTSFRPAAARSP